MAAKALESLGISLDAVRQQVEEIIGQGQQAPSGHIFTPRAKKVLEGADPGDQAPPVMTVGRYQDLEVWSPTGWAGYQSAG